MRISPASGRRRPAIVSSTVVFPAPDGPTSAVTPASNRSCSSSTKRPWVSEKSRTRGIKSVNVCRSELSPAVRTYRLSFDAAARVPSTEPRHPVLPMRFAAHSATNAIVTETASRTAAWRSCPVSVNV